MPSPSRDLSLSVGRERARLAFPIGREFRTRGDRERFPSIGRPSILIMTCRGRFLVLWTQVHTRRRSSLPCKSRVLQGRIPPSLSKFLSSHRVFRML